MTAIPFAPRRLATFGIASVALIGIAIGTYPALAQDESTPASTPAAATCDTEAAIASADTVYAIVSEESAARYIAQEELVNEGPVTAIGETQAFIGSLLFDEAGNPLPCSRFDVDLRTLVSDEARRDNYLYENTLETEEFPLATFVLASVEGLDGPLEDGETAQIGLVGDLTLHGTTQTVTWNAEVTRDGDSVSGTASLTFTLDQFEIEEPSVPVVASIDDELTLEVDIVARTGE